MPSAFAPRRGWLAALLLLCVVACVPRLTESLWYDELWATHVKLGELCLLLNAAYKDVHPPLHYTAMFAWIRLAGDSELAIRLPSLLAGLAANVVCARLGAVLVGPAAGALAAVLLALSPVHVWYATEARPYSLNLLLVLLVAWCFERLRAGDPRRRWRWGLLVAACAGVLSHYYVAVAVGVVALLATRVPGPTRRWSWGSAALAAALLGGFLLAMHRLSTLRTAMGYLTDFDLTALGRLWFTWFLGGNTLHLIGAADWLPAVVAAPLLLLGGWACRARAGLAHLLLQLLALPAVLLLMPWLGFGPSYVERSALPTLPFFLMLVAAGALALPRLLRGLAVALLVAFQAGTLVLMLSHPGATTVHIPRADWRAAAAWLAQDFATGTEVRHAFDTRGFSSARVLAYYSDAIEERSILDTDPREEQRLLVRADAALSRWPWLRGAVHGLVGDQYARLAAWKTARQRGTRLLLDRLQLERLDASVGDEVFYLLCHPEDAETEPQVRSILGDRHYRLLASVELRRVTLYKLRKREE